MELKVVGPVPKDKSITVCLLPELIPPIDSSGITQVYQAFSVTVPAKISVVISNVGGIPEIMDHGQNGWIVPPGDEIALSLALMNCIEDSDLREQKRLSGWTFAQKFDVQYLYSNFKELVSEQLG